MSDVYHSGAAIARRATRGKEVWYSLTVNGTGAGVLPGEWSREHQRQLEAAGSGQPYRPNDTEQFAGNERSKAEVRKARLELLSHGADATVKTSKLVRSLALEEAEADGTFASALAASAAEQWPTLARETFARLFGRASTIATEERPRGTEWLSAAFEKIEGGQSWQKLKQLAAGNAWSSGVAAGEIVLEVDKSGLCEGLPEEDPQRLQEEANGIRDLLGSEEHEFFQQAQLEANAADDSQLVVAKRIADGAPNADMSPEKVEEMLQAGVEKAIAVLGEVSDGMGGLSAAGVGSGASQIVGATPHEIRQALARNAQLRRIAQIAGRMRIASKQARKTKVSYVPEQIVDVTVGAEISRLLPTELLKLADDTTEILLFKRLQERQAMQYEMEGREACEKGPMGILVDASASMAGRRYEWAMGVTLALVEQAMKDRRPFFFFSFDTKANAPTVVRKPGELSIPILEGMLLKSFSNGGTIIASALQKARSMVTEMSGDWKRADLVLVSDGEDGNFAKMLTSLRDDLGVHTYGVAIESSFRAENVAEMAEVVQVSDKQIEEGNAPLDVVFQL
jgi:uncharacterized protein with von Willebrand factor type A (vWA) domain